MTTGMGTEHWKLVATGLSCQRGTSEHYCHLPGPLLEFPVELLSILQ